MPLSGQARRTYMTDLTAWAEKELAVKGIKLPPKDLERLLVCLEPRVRQINSDPEMLHRAVAFISGFLFAYSATPPKKTVIAEFLGRLVGRMLR